MAAAALACGGSPTAPGGPASLTGPVQLRLVGPNTLAPGATARLSLFEVDAAGRTVDISHRATFSGFAPDVLLVSPDGTVRGLSVGDATVMGIDATRGPTGPHPIQRIVVVPDNTFRVAGRVTEDGHPELPVAGVRVEAEGGPTGITGLDGRYLLFGVPTGGRIRFGKPGYTTTDVALQVDGHQELDVALPVSGTRLDYAGQYQMTLDTGSECRDPLLNTVLPRRYRAVITQSGREVRIVLSGARFFYGAAGVIAEPGDARVAARVTEPDNVLTADLKNYYHCEFSEVLLEQVEGGYLWIEGVLQVRHSGTGLAGTLNGQLSLLENRQCIGLPYVSLAGCRSSSFRVTFSR